MSSAFTNRPTTQHGGIPVETWLRTYWDNAVFRGENELVVDGTTLPRHKCAVQYRDFKPAYGIPGAYFATPVAIVDFRETESMAIKNGDCVVVPLGDPDWANANTRVVLQQCGRQWVSAGKNTANMSDENVLTMYYAALQSLVFTAGNATTVTDQQVWFDAIIGMVRAMALLHKANETFRRVTEAMVITPGTNDMLQKALAHIFHPDAPWDQRTKVEMLEVITRRSMRHGATVVGMAPGAFIIYVLVPLLRDVVAGIERVMNASEAGLLLARFNKEAGNLLAQYVAAASSDVVKMRAKTLVALGVAAGLEPPLTEDVATKFLDFCGQVPDMSAVAPWSEWGLLPPESKLEPVVKTERFAVGGKKGASFAARLVVHTPTTFDVLSFKGVEWCGVQFETIGTYVVKAHDLGIATASHGDTHGKELVANWRLTVGNDVLPRERHGYSLAGMSHQRSTAGKWSYVSDRPLTMSDTFTLRVTTDCVELLQRSRLFATIPRNYGTKEPALLAFKNMWLSVRFEAPVPVSETHACADAKATLELPPTALMEKLRIMAETSAKMG